MSQKKVIYKGVPMAPEWPAQIEATQLATTYKINGQVFDRIRYGDEPDLREMPFLTRIALAVFTLVRGFPPCHDCGALKGQYHVGKLCDMECCPCCRGQVISCDCDYEGDQA